MALTLSGWPAFFLKMVRTVVSGRPATRATFSVVHPFSNFALIRMSMLYIATCKTLQVVATSVKRIFAIFRSSCVNTCRVASKVRKVVAKKRKRKPARKRTPVRPASPALQRFAALLEMWMRRRGWTPKVLAQESVLKGDGTITEARLSRILHYKGSSPTLETADKYAQLFGLTLEEFYADREATALERSNEFIQFRNLLAMADPEAIQDVMKAIRHGLDDSSRRLQAKARDRPEVKQPSGSDG
jgi:transcriptional regulator with XRE-family HTH domain